MVLNNWAATHCSFYRGSIAAQLSGFVRTEDLKKYKVGRGGCTEKMMSGYKVVVPGEGSGGPLLLSTLDKFNLTEAHNDTTLAIILALQGNEQYSWKYSSGTSVTVMDDDDIYVSIISGLGSVFGSEVLTPGGFLLNNALSMSVNENKTKSDGSKVDTLMLPVIAAQESRICGRRFITGGSDARDMAQVMYRLMMDWDDDLQSSVEGARARLYPGRVELERNHAPSLEPSSIARLAEQGFKLTNASYPYPSFNVIQKFSDSMEGYADSRGGGYAIVF